MKAPSSIILLFLSACLCSCQPEPTESPTKGSLLLTVPESIAPVMRAEVEEFMRLYAKNGADVRFEVASTELAASRFVLDTARLVFLTRRLTEAEQGLVRRTAGDLIEVAVARDGIVAVVHVRNSIDRITLSELRGILEGSVRRWERLSSHRTMGGAITVYMQDSSDVSTYLRQRLFNGGPMNGRMKRTASSLATLRDVVKDPMAIGFVGLDWLDSAKVPAKVLEVSQRSEEADTSAHSPVESFGRFYSPHPAHLYRSYYPLKRSIYMYSKSARGDIASGFGTFVANKEGQRLFLARNIVPGTQPIRLKPGY